MGDANQLDFVASRFDRLQAPYLEVGSKDYGSTQDLRRLVGTAGDYIGVDLHSGPGVDIAIDMAGPPEEIVARLGQRRFGTIFCLSVLEHCRQPFAMAENLTRLLEPGGSLCLSVPFAWKFHGYPSDYWRFTHEGVKALFPQLRFDPGDCVWATSRRGDFHPIDEQLGKISFGSKAHFRRGRILRGLSARLLKLLAGVRLFGLLAGYRYVLAPTNLMMLGTMAGKPGDRNTLFENSGPDLPPAR